jgi:hypothetical protein
MKLTELQRLRFKLQIQERELAMLLRQPVRDLKGIALTKRAIQGYQDKIALFPPE